jgi:type IV secretion system protein VirB4
VAPYSSLLTDRVIVTENGDLVTTFRLGGATFQTTDDADLNDWHERLNLLWRTLADPGLALWVHLIREPHDAPALTGPATGFARRLSQRYYEKLATANLLVNRWYVTLVQRQPGLEAGWTPSFGRSRSAKRLETSSEACLDALSRSVEQVAEGLARYEPRRLCVRAGQGYARSEQLELYAQLIDGAPRHVPLPAGPIARRLQTVRTVFGIDTVEYRAATSRRLGAFLAIKDYPTPTFPGMLNGLLDAEYSFVLTQSFTFLPRAVAQGMIQRQLNRLRSSGDLAQSQANGLRKAQDDLASNRFAVGDHHLSLQVLTDAIALHAPSAPLVAQLDQHVAQARVTLGDAGIVTAREDLALESAYRAQLPANFADRPRRAAITTRNFAGLAPFHAHPAGQREGNHWGEALAVLKGGACGPYYLSLHANDQSDGGSGGRKDTGHTFVCGPTGSGKSVFVGFCIALMIRQQVSQVVLDKDHGLEILITALGGEYQSLELGHNTGLNPLRLTPSRENLDFLRRWLGRLAGGQVPLTAGEQVELRQALAGTMDLPPAERCLSRLLEFIDPTDPNGLHQRLSRWCRATDGEYAWVFDNDDDRVVALLDRTTLVGFDLTELFKARDVLGPVAFYLFHLVRALLDGRRFALWADEFSSVLEDPAFVSFARDGLKTWRKLNALAVLATQSPSDVLASPISRTLIEQTATKVFFPNPDADETEYRNGFGLSSREYDLVRRQLVPGSRRFLVKQGHASVVCELDLRGMAAEINVLSGRSDLVARARQLRKTSGTGAGGWLSVFMGEEGECHD